MPSVDKAKISTNIEYFYDSVYKIYRPKGKFNTSYYESGIIGGKHFEFHAKNIYDGTYPQVNTKSTDEVDYYVWTYPGYIYKDPIYQDDSPELSSGGMHVSENYQLGNITPKFSHSSSDYYSITTNLNTCLRYYTDVNFFIVFVPWRFHFYVNLFNTSAVNSFKDMKIIKKSSSSYEIEVPRPTGAYGTKPDQMFYYTGNTRNILNKDSNSRFVIKNTFGNNLTYSFVPKWDLSQACDNEDNAARYIEWPSYVNIEFRKFDKPTIKIQNNDTLVWNISQSNYVQEGYDVYLDDIYYVTTKDTKLELPKKYRVGNHKASIKVRANTTTVNLGNYNIRYIPSAKGNFVDYTEESVVAFIESDTASYSYTGKVQTPSLFSEKRTKVDEYTVEWYQVLDADGYVIEIDHNNRLTTQSTSFTHKYFQGAHHLSIKAYIEIDSVIYQSDPLEIDFYLDKIAQPSNISFTRNIADGGSLFWSSVTEAEAFGNIKEYTIKVNGIEYNTNGNTYNLIDLPIGTNEVYVKSNYGPNTSYNSDYKYYKFTDANIIKKLSTPTLIAEEIINSDTKGVEALKLSWDNISYASGYVLDDYYEVYNDESGLWEGTHIEDDLIATEKIIKFNIGQGVGKHTYKVKAYYKEFINDFTSDYSTTPDKGIIEVSKLKPITGLKWKSYDTKKHRDESTLIWNRVKDENYYRVFALKSGESGAVDSKGYVIKAEGTQTKFDFDILNMSGVANQLSTADYDVYIRCYNFDTLYYQPSEISNRLSYDVIQLDPPTGLKFDNNTQTLSWNKVNMATSYIIYKVGEPQPITETKELSYTFPDLGAGFFKFYVIAKRTVMEEE